MTTDAALHAACPFCAARPGEPCRTPVGGPSFVHGMRRMAWRNGRRIAVRQD